MKTIWNSLKRLWTKRRKGEAKPERLSRRLLREFVYLDEVSLCSLLSSKTGGVTESMSKETRVAVEETLSSRLEVNAAALAKSEASSRFQTSNSSTIQTSRKATVQSWFAELLDLPKLRKIRPVCDVDPVDAIEDVDQITTPSTFVRCGDLARGDLVEFRAVLSADPVFRLETMVTEFAGMAEDYPDMFGAEGALAKLHEVLPVNKVLQRMLAGLIPIRARAIDHVIVERDGVEALIHRDVIAGHEVKTKPLEIVGVTEHLAYWKDIRRVLFSDAIFTILARVSRPGLHDVWAPVKLADLFKQISPNLVAKISAASLISQNSVRTEDGSVSSTDLQLEAALRHYASERLKLSEHTLTDEQLKDLEPCFAYLRERSSAVSDQRGAFDKLDLKLERYVELNTDPKQKLDLRKAARLEAGLSLFPSMTVQSHSATKSSLHKDTVDSRLLDVEIIAIYW